MNAASRIQSAATIRNAPRIRAAVRQANTILVVMSIAWSTPRRAARDGCMTDCVLVYYNLLERVLSSSYNLEKPEEVLKQKLPSANGVYKSFFAVRFRQIITNSQELDADKHLHSHFRDNTA